MLRTWSLWLVPWFAACAADRPPAPASTATSPAPAAEVLVGPTDRDAIVASEPRFSPERAPAPDPQVTARLRTVAPGAEVTVVLGTWCGDSWREVSRWFRTLDAIGSPPPFRVEYIAVSWARLAPGIESLGIAYVPTFIVRREGVEVGRVVESAPEGIEHAVLSLLAGEAHGVITGQRER